MKIWLSFHGRWPAGRLRKACADPCATPCAKLFSYGNYNCLKSTLPQHRCTFKHAAQNAFCALLLNTAATRVTSWLSWHSELTSSGAGAVFRACHHLVASTQIAIAHLLSSPDAYCNQRDKHSHSAPARDRSPAWHRSIC